MVVECANRHLHRFVSLEAKVLQGDDPNALHDFRVASRRLQQVLDLLYPNPRPKKLRKLRRRIQRARRTLSEVRNCDVLNQRVSGLLARNRVGHRESWTAFRDYLKDQRPGLFHDAVAMLSRLNLADFYVQLQGCLNSRLQSVTDSGNGTDHSPTGEWIESDKFQERAARELHRLWGAFQDKVSNAGNDPASRSLHAVRVAAKRLRYLVEAISELGVPGSSEVLVRLRHLQQLLGDWHDLEVMEQTMAAMVTRPAFLRHNIAVSIKIERLMLQNQKKKQAYERKYFEVQPEIKGWPEMEELVSSLAAQGKNVPTA